MNTDDDFDIQLEAMRDLKKAAEHLGELVLCLTDPTMSDEVQDTIIKRYQEYDREVRNKWDHIKTRQQLNPDNGPSSGRS